jgi:hypothetical protein
VVDMTSYPGHGGQDMDESLEEMWMTSTRDIQEIDPGRSFDSRNVLEICCVEKFLMMMTMI